MNLELLTIRAKGFSMLEVLISLFILSIGVMGAVGLQLASLRTAQQSAFHSVAVALSNELAEKMRSSDAQMKLADGANVFSTIKYNSQTDGNPPIPTLCYSTAASCSSTELAKADIYEWLVRVKKSLPGARVLVCRDSAASPGSGKQLTWGCSSASNAGFVIKIGWTVKNPDGTFVEKRVQESPNFAISVESYVR